MERLDKGSLDRGSFKTAAAKTDCPFCREPCHDTDEEGIIKIKKRMEVNDGAAFHMMAFNSLNGTMSLPQDTKKSFELWVRATELGSVDAANSLSLSYMHGRGVDRDFGKAKHYMQVAAMGGHPGARYNLGHFEEESGNMERALKHYMIAARSGLDQAMKKLYQVNPTDELVQTLKAHFDYKKEVNTPQRARAAAAFGT
ncbi:hypothetical protein ACHAXR_013442 [Thalassiosira sp. AJA248-18]